MVHFRQSYDVDIEINIPGTSAKSCNTLDLKNPFFRYTGQAPQPPPGTNSGSATEQYWNNLAAGMLDDSGLYCKASLENSFMCEMYNEC